MRKVRCGAAGMLRDNRGATITVVLVAMAFVATLGSVLLYLSLLNLQMKKMDRQGQENFYAAEAAMNEIRAGLQRVVSDAVREAYSSVLVSYNTATPEEQENTFRVQFFARLAAARVYSAVEGEERPLFDEGLEHYDAALLINFVSNPAGVTVYGSGDVSRLPDGSGLVLEDVAVRYSQRGYETKVLSDIKVLAPALPYTSAELTQTTAPDFAVVCRGALIQPAGTGTVSVSGGVCAGGVLLSGSGNVLDVRNSPAFVSAGPVRIEGGRASFDLRTALWAGDIVLEDGAELTVAGDMYVADDLNLRGNNSRAVLSGRYFGYGTSADDPYKSSAIVINGKNTVLDMSSLRALFLAGHSFVNYGTGQNGYVLMGPSLSVRSDQLAYLVPENCLAAGVTNPYRYTEDPGNDVLQTYVLLDQKVIGDKTLRDYGITNPAEHVKYIRKAVGDTHLVYFCLNFPSASAASAYFADYFNLNREQLQKYLDVYSDGILLLGPTVKNLAGPALKFDEGTDASDGPGDLDDGPAELIKASGAPAATVEEIARSCANLKVTLSRTKSGEQANAYEYFVNISELEALSGAEEYPAGGEAKAVAVNGGYTIDGSTPGTVHLVIASGDVEVCREFSGLIIAGGDVRLYASVSSSRADVAEALMALLAEGQGGARYYRYLNPEAISPQNLSTASGGSGGVWDLNALVKFENWAKNAA